MMTDGIGRQIPNADPICLSAPITDPDLQRWFCEGADCTAEGIQFRLMPTFVDGAISKLELDMRDPTGSHGGTVHAIYSIAKDKYTATLTHALSTNGLSNLNSPMPLPDELSSKLESIVNGLTERASAIVAARARRQE